MQDDPQSNRILIVFTSNSSLSDFCDYYELFDWDSPFAILNHSNKWQFKKQLTDKSLFDSYPMLLCNDNLMQHQDIQELCSLLNSITAVYVLHHNYPGKEVIELIKRQVKTSVTFIRSVHSASIYQEFKEVLQHDTKEQALTRFFSKLDRDLWRRKTNLKIIKNYVDTQKKDCNLKISVENKCQYFDLDGIEIIINWEGDLEWLERFETVETGIEFSYLFQLYNAVK